MKILEEALHRLKENLIEDVLAMSKIREDNIINKSKKKRLLCPPATNFS